MSPRNFSSSRPLVSAIIPAYQRYLKVQRAIDSVAAQSYKPLELILVDDGSNPALKNKVALPNNVLNRSLIIRHNSNLGANAARATGIKEATGRYIAFLDSDDEWHPHKIERQVNCLEAGEGSCEASYTGIRHVDAGGRTNAVRVASQQGSVLKSLLHHNVIGTFSVLLISRTAVEAVGPPDASMPCWQDWQWYLRLASAGVRFHAIRDPLVTKHTAGNRISGDFERKRDQAYPRIRQQIENIADSRELARIAVAHLDFQLGRAALANRRYSEARRLFLRAIRRHSSEPAFYLQLAMAGRHYPFLRKLKRSVIRLTTE